MFLPLQVYVLESPTMFGPMQLRSTIVEDEKSISLLLMQLDC
ncbi:MAG: hypothetical protein ACD_73C00253G0001 [uncultured bacterium]|nr:MAG: hypothetical protein ACD_73C00253G0001 [uncultured bacterium]